MVFNSLPSKEKERKQIKKSWISTFRAVFKDDSEDDSDSASEKLFYSDEGKEDDSKDSSESEGIDVSVQGDEGVNIGVDDNYGVDVVVEYNEGVDVGVKEVVNSELNFVDSESSVNNELNERDWETDSDCGNSDDCSEYVPSMADDLTD